MLLFFRGRDGVLQGARMDQSPTPMTPGGGVAGRDTLHLPFPGPDPPKLLS